MKILIIWILQRFLKCSSNIKIQWSKITNKKHVWLKWMNSMDAILNSMLAHRKNQSLQTIIKNFHICILI
jgi:hypothetical protein